MRRGIKGIRSVFCVAALLTTGLVQAGLTDLVRQMNTDTLTWRVQVKDAQGNPVPAATVWRIIPNGNQRENVELMKQLVRRYSFDKDFVMNAIVHPSLMVSYANKDGYYLHSDTVIYHKSNDVTTIYAVLKRGYLPKIVSDVARKNTTHDLTIVLEHDVVAPVDPRMLQLDFFRAQAHIPAATAAERMQEDRREATLRAQQNLRALAQSLEQDKQFDLASAVYYNLAYLPSVDAVRNSDGSEKIVGYTNGYSEKNPQRKSDMDKALDLNQSNPNLKLQRMLRTFPRGDLGDISPSQRRDYINLVEALIKQYAERIWPTIYFVSYQYLDEGQYVEACVALNRAYRFEPTYSDTDEWRKILASHNWRARRAGYQGDCELAGLPEK